LNENINNYYLIGDPNDTPRTASYAVYTQARGEESFPGVTRAVFAGRQEPFFLIVSGWLRHCLARYKPWNKLK